MGKDMDAVDVEKLYERSRYKKNSSGFYQLFLKRIFDIAVCIVILPLILMADRYSISHVGSEKALRNLICLNSDL